MKTISVAFILCTGLLLASAQIVRAADEKLDAATQARVDRFDKGPATVDVSQYPALIQKDYREFSMKCSACHTLARPINSDYALPDEWSRYVKRMMFKPGSNITKNAAKKIYTFLVYDSSVRKKELWAQNLAKLSPADQAAQEAKLKAILSEIEK